MAQGFTQGLSHPTTHPYLPPTIAGNKFRRHHRSLVTTPLPAPPTHIPLSHYPPGENSSVLCVRVYTYTHICLRKLIYVSVRKYMRVRICVRVWGVLRPHHLSGTAPKALHASVVYIYIYVRIYCIGPI